MVLCNDLKGKLEYEVMHKTCRVVVTFQFFSRDFLAKVSKMQSMSLQLISSDRSSYSDAVILDTVLLSQIFIQSIDAIDVTSVTLSCLNSINAIDVTRC